MLFTKATLLSLVALAAALPNAMPEPEPAAQLEARTFSWKWNLNKCECDCPKGNYKRDVDGLEARTLWLLLGNKDNCGKICKKKCDDYYDGTFIPSHGLREYPSER